METPPASAPAFESGCNSVRVGRVAHEIPRAAVSAAYQRRGVLSMATKGTMLTIEEARRRAERATVTFPPWRDGSEQGFGVLVPGGIVLSCWELNQLLEPVELSAADGTVFVGCCVASDQLCGLAAYVNL